MLACIELGAQSQEGDLVKTPATQPTDKNEQSAVASLSNYATDNFFAAWFFRPSELAKSEFFKAFSIDSFVPTPVSLSRAKTRV